MRFIHTADIHLGKTYRRSAAETERYADFFRCLDSIIADALAERVDFVLIAGDLFHTGQILPRTFAGTIECLLPLKEAGIPCIVVEGNHDWIHRRDSISWMEALSAMGYVKLLRPDRSDEGGYRFSSFDEETGQGGMCRVGDLHIYGLGYIGSQAGSHVPRICEAVTTEKNLLLFHVGIWKYSPVEIGNMGLQEAYPLAEVFDYVALGHGHKPYAVETPEGKKFAFNPGAPERVNFGEERYDKGYYLVQEKGGVFEAEFRPTDPRPMMTLTVSLNGADTVEEALQVLKQSVLSEWKGTLDGRRPLLEMRLTGRVGFHPFEIGRERLKLLLEELLDPLHLEVKNHLSLVTPGFGDDRVRKSLADIEREVLNQLVGNGNEYRGREEELVALALAMRDLVHREAVDEEDLLSLLDGEI
ncbi:MAG: exonuclease SbcCD subunit D [Syntrophotaleaceae bacterium]